MRILNRGPQGIVDTWFNGLKNMLLQLCFDAFEKAMIINFLLNKSIVVLAIWTPAVVWAAWFGVLPGWTGMSKAMFMQAMYAASVNRKPARWLLLGASTTSGTSGEDLVGISSV